MQDVEHFVHRWFDACSARDLDAREHTQGADAEYRRPDRHSDGIGEIVTDTEEIAEAFPDETATGPERRPAATITQISRAAPGARRARLAGNDAPTGDREQRR